MEFAALAAEQDKIYEDYSCEYNGDVYNANGNLFKGTVMGRTTTHVDRFQEGIQMVPSWYEGYRAEVYCGKSYAAPHWGGQDSGHPVGA